MKWFVLLFYIFTGFSVIDRGCCGLGKNKGEVTCLPFQTPCPNRDEYLFWDAYHPTSAVNLLLGSMAFSRGPNYSYPMNIEQLARLWDWTIWINVIVISLLYQEEKTFRNSGELLHYMVFLVMDGNLLHLWSVNYNNLWISLSDREGFRI